VDAFIIAASQRDQVGVQSGGLETAVPGTDSWLPERKDARRSWPPVTPSAFGSPRCSTSSSASGRQPQLRLRIVDEAKSKYYRFALSHLARAKRCYVKAGLAKEWEATVKDVRKRHHRKPSFIPGFEKVVKGLLSKRSSFLDRARKRRAGPPQG
jgi:hypothetical protein